jgi:O-antigen ligase
MYNAILILIFFRPFICSLAFPYVDFIHSGCLIIALAGWISVKGAEPKNIGRIKYPLLLFLAALLISLIFSQNKMASIGELPKYGLSLLLLIAASSFTFKQKNELVKTILAAGIIISLLAIYQYSIGFKHTLDYLINNNIADPFVKDYIGRKRAFLPFLGPNALGGYLSMVIPLALIHKRKILLVIPLCLALLLTKSIGAMASLFFGLAFYLFLKGKITPKKAFYLAGAAAIIILTLILRSSAPQAHIKPAFSAIMRFNYWADTLRVIKAHIFTGVGIGNLNISQSIYAHNSYLQIFAEMGFLGITAFIWIIFAAFKAGAKKMKNPGEESRLASALVLSLIIFLFHNLIDYTFFLPEISVTWWLILGLI